MDKKRRSSKYISLAILSMTIVSCTKEAVKNEVVSTNGQDVFMRADTTAKFTDVSNRVVSTRHYNEAAPTRTVEHVHHNNGMSTSDAMLMYMMFNNNSTGGNGYTSSSLSHESNVGSNVAKQSYTASSPSYKSTTSSYSSSPSKSSYSSSSSKSSSISRSGFGSSSFRSSAS